MVLKKPAVKFRETETRSFQILNLSVSNNYQFDDFRYMKFIYLHCSGEMKLRAPRS